MFNCNEFELLPTNFTIVKPVVASLDTSTQTRPSANSPISPPPADRDPSERMRRRRRSASRRRAPPEPSSAWPHPVRSRWPLPPPASVSAEKPPFRRGEYPRTSKRARARPNARRRPDGSWPERVRSLDQSPERPGTGEVGSVATVSAGTRSGRPPRFRAPTGSASSLDARDVAARPAAIFVGSKPQSLRS